MKNFYIRRSSLTNLASALLFVLALLTSPTPGAADAITYTYTGNPFTYELPGSVWPSTPAIGDHISCSFTYDGDLSAVLNINLLGAPALSSFSIACGDVVLPTGPTTYRYLNIAAVDGLGRPSEWYIFCDDTEMGRSGYRLSTVWMTGYWSGDEAWFSWGEGDGESAHVLNVDSPGPWTAVPLPSSAFLLGTGLIGLTGWRRFRKG